VRRLGIAERLLLTVTLPIIAVAVFALWQVRAELGESALLQLKGQLLALAQRYAAEVSTQLEKAVTIANTTAETLAINPTTDEDRLYALLESNLDSLSIVYGSALAFEPGQIPGKRLFSPYVYRGGVTGKARMDIAVEAYDYTRPEWEWWNGPRNDGQPIWTAPYFDKGAGNIWMVTYSAPIQRDRQFVGVATVDLDLGKLHDNLNLEGLRATDYVILTNTGHFAYHYRKELIGQSYTQLIDKLGVEQAAYVARQMLSGESGFFEYRHDGTSDWVLYAPVGHFGWSFAVQLNLGEAVRLAGMDRTPVYVWSAVVAVFGILASWLAARVLLLVPLRHLEEGAAKLKVGVPADLPDSLGSRQADRVAARLKEAGDAVQKTVSGYTTQVDALNRTLAEKLLQLKVSEKRQSALLDAARNATFVVNQSGVVLATNDKAERLLGRHRDEIIDASLSRWITAPQRSAFVAALDRLFGNMDSQTLGALQVEAADGRSLTVNAVFTPIFLPDGEVEGDVIFVTENT
jgi:PAS domain S-box-containing protein